MGEFLIRHIDRASGLELARFAAPNLLAYEGMDAVYRQMFPPYAAAIDFKLGVAGPTDQGRPNSGGGLAFDHELTLENCTDADANEGGCYTPAMRTSFGYVREAVTFIASLQADGGQIATPEVEFPNQHDWTPQDGDAWDDPGTTQIEQPPPEWAKQAPDDPLVGYPWHAPRKLCFDVGTPPLVSSAYMKQWDATGDLDWLCDFRKLGGFPITLAFIAPAQPWVPGVTNKLIAAATFADNPILLRPGTSVFVTYRARIDGPITRDFAYRFARWAFEHGGARYTTIYCRPALMPSPAATRRSVYGDFEPYFHDDFPALALDAWSYSAGTPPFMTSDTVPQWINNTGQTLSFDRAAIYGSVGGANELMWAVPIEPAVTVPHNDVLRIAGGVKFTLESV